MCGWHLIRFILRAKQVEMKNEKRYRPIRDQELSLVSHTGTTANAGSRLSSEEGQRFTSGSRLGEEEASTVE